MKVLYYILFYTCIVAFTANGQTKEAYVNAGEKAMSEKKYGEAIYYLSQALEFPNPNPGLQIRMAKACQMHKDYKQAAYWYSFVVKNDSLQQYTQLLHELGEMTMCIENYFEAKNYLSQALIYVNDSLKRALIERQMLGCELAMNDSTTPIWNVSRYTNNINTVFSDFAAHGQQEDDIYFSSIRYQKISDKPKEYFSKIYHQKKSGSNASMNISPLDFTINRSGYDNGSSSLSNDGKIFIFTRCKDVNGENKCELYESVLLNQHFQQPKKLQASINLEGFSNIQPWIVTNGPLGYTLYFSSNRENGMGGFDIWKCHRNSEGIYSDAINCGKEINSPWDEITPFYDVIKKTLYFSSNGYPGYGAMDVFYVQPGIDSFPVNLGAPVNSGADDTFFNHSISGYFGLLTSNRKGSSYISNETCCYDIYLLKRDTNLIEQLDTLKVKPELSISERIQEIKKLMPIRLYFDNDIPDPGSRKSTTDRNYIDLYRDYVQMQNTYQEFFSEGLTDEQSNIAVEKVNAFFEDELKTNFEKLNQFMILLQHFSDLKYTLQFKIRGQASPLADKEYNNKLSGRRISSLQNYLRMYENGMFINLLHDSLIQIIEIPKGEELSDHLVSDKLDDIRNSVYNPAAALERKIEIIDLIIEPQ